MIFIKNIEINNKFKTIEKLINNGYDSDEKIKNIKLDDIFSIKGLTSIDIQNIKKLIEALKNKKFIAFFIDENIKGGGVKDLNVNKL